MPVPGFDYGTGADGALVVPSGTTTLTENGTDMVKNYSSIEVQSGGNLVMPATNPNPTAGAGSYGAPDQGKSLHIKCTGTVDVQSGGIISLDGVGHAGGPYSGGMHFNRLAPGAAGDHGVGPASGKGGGPAPVGSEPPIRKGGGGGGGGNGGAGSSGASGTAGYGTDYDGGAGGSRGGAVEFTGVGGTNLNRVRIGNDPTLNTHSFTIEMWALVDTVPGPHGASGGIQFLAHKNSFSGSWRLWLQATGHVEFDALSDQVNVVSTAAISAAAWHHIVATHDTDAEVMVLYVDGTAHTASTAATSGSMGGTYNNYVDLGSESGSNIYWMDGKIDEVRLYNRAITEAEVLAHYNSGAGVYCNPADETGLVGLYHADESSGTLLTDTSGLDNHGTLSAEAAFSTAGKVQQGNADLSPFPDRGNAFYARPTLAGVGGSHANRWVTAPHIAAYNIAGDAHGSTAYWYRQEDATTAAGTQTIFHPFPWTTGTGSFHTNGTPDYRGGGWNGLTYLWAGYPGVFLPTLGQWHFVVGTYDGTTPGGAAVDGVSGGTLKIYVDGVLRGTRIGTNTTNPGNPTVEFLFVHDAGGALPYTGDLDQLAWYDRTLTADDVAYLYNNGAGREIPEDDPGLLLGIHADETLSFGRTTRDSTPQRVADVSTSNSSPYKYWYGGAVADSAMQPEIGPGHVRRERWSVLDAGSGGGSGSYGVVPPSSAGEEGGAGGGGGGALRITAAKLINNGTIRANGLMGGLAAGGTNSRGGNGGGGAGGSILLEADAMEGAGVLQAIGAAAQGGGNGVDAGAGGGGRIHRKVAGDSQGWTISVAGGAGTAAPVAAGEVGTATVETMSTGAGILIA